MWASTQILTEKSSTPKPKDVKLCSDNHDRKAERNSDNTEASTQAIGGEDEDIQKKRKRQGPKHEWNFDVLIVNKTVKRCQHCRKGFEQNSPGNLMVGKFDENTYLKRHGGRARATELLFSY